MRLTPFQRILLKNLLELQTREPSYKRALRALVPFWIVFIAVGFVAWYLIRTWLNGGGLEYIALGLVLGAIASQIGNFRNFVQGWSVQKRALDFDAVRRMLEEDDAAKAAGQPAPAPGRRLTLGTVAAIGLGVVALVVALDWGMKAYHDPTRTTVGKQVKLYATSWCGHCRVVRKHLAMRGVEYEEHDVEKSIAAHAAWRATDSRGVPVTVIGGTVVRGANLAKLDQALRDAGHTLRESGPAAAPSGEAIISPLKR